MDIDINRRNSFNSEAERYHANRPRYPEALFDALVRETKLKPSAQLLEIGPGTGQATEPLAKRGYNITAVELGEEMASYARKSLVNFPNVKIITGAFEDVELPENSFDLVFAATAFHWIKPDFKFAKPHKILKSGGHLAVIKTNHVSDEKGDKFIASDQPIYDRFFPKSKAFVPKKASDLGPEQIDQNLFEVAYFGKFPLTIKYPVNNYLDLLDTHSDIIILPDEEKRKFFDDIKNLVNDQFGGIVERPYIFTLTIAKKK